MDLFNNDVPSGDSAMLTLEQLKKIMPQAGARADRFLDALNEAMEEFEINTPGREAAFLAQLAHESGSLRYVRELASGEAYEGRADLGNTQAGDGVRFKGRGLIQITGRANYKTCGDALDLPLVDQPELLEETDNACRSAAWFWDTRQLNALADQGEFLKISKRINGVNRKTGFPNGWEDRLANYERAQQVMGA
jgi:putative chitinase